jgi:SET domain-containing protein 6
MFWSDEQIQELKGTDIIDKIGRQSAEETYSQKIKPILEVSRRQSLFHPNFSQSSVHT